MRYEALFGAGYFKTEELRWAFFFGSLWRALCSLLHRKAIVLYIYENSFSLYISRLETNYNHPITFSTTHSPFPSLF